MSRPWHASHAIVHDLDLNDGRFGAKEAPTVGTLIEGLQLSIPEDEQLLKRGMGMFESNRRRRARRDGGIRADVPGPGDRRRHDSGGVLGCVQQPPGDRGV
jgi:hypothetical protein